MPIKNPTKKCSHCFIDKAQGVFKKGCRICLECRREHFKKYKQTERGKEILRRDARKQSRKRYYKNKNKCFARGAINDAVRYGKIPHINSLNCIDCGIQAKERHHHLGYEKKHWLDTIPLCISCHKKIHLGTPPVKVELPPDNPGE